MKKTIVVCDITGKETNCKEITFRIGQEEQSYLDAAGDSDYRMIDFVRTYDLSHEGALMLLANLIENLKDNTSVSVSNNRLQKALDKAVNTCRN